MYTFSKINMRFPVTKARNCLLIKKKKYSFWSKFLPQAEYVLSDKSFKNIEWLAVDEISSLTIHAENIRNIQHPIADVARNIAYNEDINLGLIVMLLSKCAGKYTEKDMHVDDIWQNQYTIARVTQMLNMAVKIHESVCNKCSVFSEKNYGNKIAILCGDYLLAKCLQELARLEDFYTVELMSSAVRDLTIAQHLEPRDNENRPYPTKPTTTQVDVSFIDTFSVEPIQMTNWFGNPQAEWTFRATLGGGTLLGKGCSSVLKLAGFPQAYQNIGYSFGKYFSLAYQALNDIKLVSSGSPNFSLVSLPVLLHLRNDHCLYNEIEKERENGGEVDRNLVHSLVLSSNALAEANEMRKEFLNAACSILDTFEVSDAQILLRNITKSMESEGLSST